MIFLRVGKFLPHVSITVCKEYYTKESVQWEIRAGNRTGTVEQMDANVEAMARDLQEILRIGAEQKRLWEVYEGKVKG